MLRNIRLNGELGKRYGRKHTFDVSSPGEAFRALAANHPDFSGYVTECARNGVTFKVVADGDILDEKSLDAPFSRNLTITPVVSGGAFIGAPIVAAFLGTSTAFAAAFYGTASLVVGTILAGVALNGISRLLAPHPKASTSSSKEENPYFDGPTQIAAQGASVPFGYGEMIVGSITISASITVEDQYSSVPFMGGYAGNLGVL